MKSKALAAFVAASLLLSGCATGANGQRRSALDRSINECVAAVFIGALAGAALDKNRGQGALIGAGIGGVACGVLVAINNEHDKQEIRNAQLAALNANMQQTEQFVGQDGETKTVTTSIQDAPTPAAGDTGNPEQTDGMSTAPDTVVGPCRRTQTQISAQTGSAQLPAEMYCRTAGGDWVIYNS